MDIYVFPGCVCIVSTYSDLDAFLVRICVNCWYICYVRIALYLFIVYMHVCLLQ